MAIVKWLHIMTAMGLVGVFGCDGGQTASPPASPSLQASSREIHDAVMVGDWDEVNELLEKGYSVNAQEPTSGMTVLNIAAARGHEEIVRLLLDRGADVSIRGVGGDTALFHAARKGEASIVALLLDKGANPNAVTRHGTTPLMAAEHAGSERVVELLLQAGAGHETVSDTNATNLSRK